MKLWTVTIGAAAMLLCAACAAAAFDDAALYRHAREELRQGNVEAAFLFYHLILHTSDDAAHRAEALFAVGEYYFSHGARADAEAAFAALHAEYPAHPAALYAAVYLYAAAGERGDTVAQFALKKKIIESHRLSLLFRESRAYEYRSPLGTLYRAVYFIDKMELYRAGALFETVYF